MPIGICISSMTLRKPLVSLPRLRLGHITRCMRFAIAHPNCAFGTTSHTPKPLDEILSINNNLKGCVVKNVP